MKHITFISDYKTSKGEKIYLLLMYIFMGLVAITMIFPLLTVVAKSFSSTRAITSGEVTIFPVDFTFQSYQNIFRDGVIVRTFVNTVFTVVIGTAFNMIFTILCAYPLSKRNLLGRKQLMLFISFTMMFGGGMIPNFLLIKSLHIMDTYWSIWLPPLISVSNMVILRSNFEGIPESISEAAEIDGANEVYKLVKIILPLSVPVLATLTLFYAVGMWNSYMPPLLYITSTNKQLIMVKLMQMIQQVSDSTKMTGEGAIEEQLTPESIKAATIVVSIVPIMCIYPFLQKYFVTGIMVGGVKG